MTFLTSARINGDRLWSTIENALLAGVGFWTPSIRSDGITPMAVEAPRHTCLRGPTSPASSCPISSGCSCFGWRSSHFGRFSECHGACA
jgi:hypothetical protein